MTKLKVGKRNIYKTAFMNE